MAASESSIARRPIVLVSNGFQANYERGFSNGLAALGADVTLVSSDGTDYAGLLPGVKTVNLRGSQDSSRPKWQKVLNLVLYQLRLAAYLLRAGRPVVQVIGLIDPPLLYGVVDGWFFKRFASRYVLTVHNLLPQDGCTPEKEAQFARSYQLADHLVVHTETMKAGLATKFGIDTGRITVMEHGLEPLPAAPAAAVPRTGGPLVLLCFGFVRPYKGVDVLLQALETVDEPFVLRIVGLSRDGELTRKLRAAIEAHPHASAITWRDEHVDEAEMERLFTESDVLVMPYRHIDQSGVLFQALRFGLPVLATRVGSLAHYVTPDVGEVCAPADAADLRDALQRLMRRYGEFDRARIVEAGRRWEWQRTIAAATPRPYG